MKFPIGIQDFKSIRQDGFVYVDKTHLLYKLANEGEIYFLCRPRRFGKSLLVSTLKYYFNGDKELFAGLAIEPLEKEWLQYPIFHIDFNGSDFSVGSMLQNKLDVCVEEWERQYGIKGDARNSVGERFAKVLKCAHRQTGRRCVSALAHPTILFVC